MEGSCGGRWGDKPTAKSKNDKRKKRRAKTREQQREKNTVLKCSWRNSQMYEHPPSDRTHTQCKCTDDTQHTCLLRESILPETDLQAFSFYYTVTMLEENCCFPHKNPNNTSSSLSSLSLHPLQLWFPEEQPIDANSKLQS